METDREEKIRARAHMIWEREGWPSGRAGEHWAQAEREIENEEDAGAAAGTLKVTAHNDPTRPGGPLEGGAYPDAGADGERRNR